jgi:hypothetical protein
MEDNRMESINKTRGNEKEIITEGIKSKSRVKDHGEVFTPKNIVVDMMDLLKEEGYRVESKVLEPSCGNGNFLVEIIKRKMEQVNDRYKESNNDINVYNLNLAIAVSNIYGIDILPDNIDESRDRMRNGTPGDTDHIGYIARYKEHTGQDIPDWLDKTLQYLMERNIQLGNTLTNRKLADTGGNQTGDAGDLIMCKWVFDGNIVKRDEFLMENLDMSLEKGYAPISYDKLYTQKDITAEDEEEIEI